MELKQRHAITFPMTEPVSYVTITVKQTGAVWDVIETTFVARSGDIPPTQARKILGSFVGPGDGWVWPNEGPEARATIFATAYATLIRGVRKQLLT